MDYLIRRILKILLIVLVLLVGCSPSGASTIVTFRHHIRPENDGHFWIVDYAEEGGVRLSLRGILALDNHTAFLFGHLGPNPGPLYSVLLKTNDGGQSWTEIMEQVPASSISNFVILEDGYGWALATFIVETTSGTRVFRTTDFGSTWTEVSHVGGVNMFPISITMMNQVDGRLELFQQNGNPHTDGFYELMTIDSGVTWEQTVFLPASEMTYEEQSSYYRGDQTMNQAGDGSEWQLVSQESDDAYAILRRLSPNDDWETVSIIRKKYGYLDGMILTATPSGQ